MTRSFQRRQVRRLMEAYGIKSEEEAEEALAYANRLQSAVFPPMSWGAHWWAVINKAAGDNVVRGPASWWAGVSPVDD